MFEGRRVTVVIPAHNEEKLIGQVLETMPAFVDRIVVVDDASQDRTPEILGEAGRRMGARLHVIRHEGNGGVGAAIISGYRAALEQGKEGSLVAVMAGDAQMDPADLPAMRPKTVPMVSPNPPRYPDVKMLPDMISPAANTLSMTRPSAICTLAHASTARPR